MRRTDSAMDTREPSKEPRNEGEGSVGQALDVRVLGVRSSSGLNKLDFAFVRYRQDSPSAPLCIQLLKARESAVVEVCTD